MANSNDNASGIATADDLFSMDLDQLADLPSFEVPPAGSYILEVSMDVKEISKKQAVEASFKVVETVELADADADEVAPGTEFGTIFFIDNKFGVGNLKKFLKPFSAHFGTSNVGELVWDHVKAVTISGLVKTRADKEDPDKVYGNVVNITVV